MYQKNCCRTCLSTGTLYPIFVLPEHREKYTNTIYEATGVKIEINDTLSQKMCTNCISFINESIKFRRKCETVQKILQQNIEIDIKMDTYEKTSTEIDINVYLDEENDFKDYDDNITLDAFQYHEVPIEIDTEKSGDDKMFEKKSLRTRKIKKKDIDKKERTKEEIQCELCQKILTSKLSLRNHYKIHSGFDVVCEHCGKKFITRRLLLMHCRAKHGYEKTDKCSFCDYRASNAEQVKIHERLHTGEKPFVCKDCSAGFHRKSSYLQHIAIHLPEKTVQCDQCPARFKSVTLMRIHKNRHRPPQYTFKCGVCENNFARRRNVARHLQRVHGLPPDVHIQRHKLH